MSKINLLKSEIYNKIAAGEVIEKPYSVIKELVENSIDAKSSYIKIEIFKGGLDSIIVTDDGEGMEQEDIEKAFLPHATSKISSSDDLFAIKTLGFRGEALASIAAVSKVTIKSKTQQSTIANYLVLEDEKILEKGECSFSVGTKITVENLFYNTPARLKFIKSPKSEKSEITNLVERLILANPKIRFEYYADNEQIYNYDGKSIDSAVNCVYGKAFLENSYSFAYEEPNYKIYGRISKPNFCKPNRTYQTLILNGRYIQNSTIQTAVTNAYADYIFKRQFPFFVLYFEVEHSLVDINAHPTKMDVRFAEQQRLFGLFLKSISNCLKENAIISMSQEKELPQETTEKLSFFKPKVINLNFSDSVQSNAQSSNNYTDYKDVNIFMTSQASGNSDADTQITQSENRVLNRMISQAGKSSSEVDTTFAQSKSRVLNLATDQVGDSSSEVDTTFAQSKSRVLNVATDQVGDSSSEVDTTFAQSGGDRFENEGNLNYAQGDFICKDSQNSKASNGDLSFPNSEKGIYFDTDKIKVIGSLFLTYNLVEVDNNFYIIDQHALHERINYDMLVSQNSEVMAQSLMIPFILNVNPSEVVAFESIIPLMCSFGFSIEQFGNNSYKVESIPCVLTSLNLQRFFDELKGEIPYFQNILDSEIVKQKLMQKACKHSIKAGDKLTETEIAYLLGSINNKTPLCPHGRPIFIRYTKTEIEKLFNRKI